MNSFNKMILAAVVVACLGGSQVFAAQQNYVNLALDEQKHPEKFAKILLREYSPEMCDKLQDLMPTQNEAFKKEFLRLDDLLYTHVYHAQTPACNRDAKFVHLQQARQVFKKLENLLYRAQQAVAPLDEQKHPEKFAKQLWQKYNSEMFGKLSALMPTQNEAFEKEFLKLNESLDMHVHKAQTPASNRDAKFVHLQQARQVFQKLENLLCSAQQAAAPEDQVAPVEPEAPAAVVALAPVAQEQIFAVENPVVQVLVAQVEPEAPVQVVAQDPVALEPVVIQEPQVAPVELEQPAVIVAPVAQVEPEAPAQVVAQAQVVRVVSEPVIVQEAQVVPEPVVVQENPVAPVAPAVQAPWWKRAANSVSNALGGAVDAAKSRPIIASAAAIAAVVAGFAIKHGYPKLAASMIVGGVCTAAALKYKQQLANAARPLIVRAFDRTAELCLRAREKLNLYANALRWNHLFAGNPQVI